MVDPRKAMLELDAIVPKDWDVVIGGGHYLGIAMTHLRGRAPAPGHAVDVLVETILAHPPRAVTLITLGPLTNVAVALAREPAPGVERVA